MSEAYQVIARKWRPQIFEDVVGQEHIVRTLQNAIERNRIAHAYLLVGPRGTGKTTTARIFAKALNCEKGPTIRPCNECASCRAITSGNSMDVLEIDGASNNSVDQIRDLRDDVRYAPSQGKFKIYIIDEVHMLTTAAFNALLKTLEEPPAHVKFIFATTEAHKVLPTIVSRCQRFELKPIPTAKIAGRLEFIAQEEKIDVEPAAIEAIARLASGGMRDAQSTLDQMIAFCGDRILAKDVEEVYGLLSVERIGEIARSVQEGDETGILESVEILDQDGRDFFRALQDVQNHFSDLLIAALRKKEASSPDAETITRILESLRESSASLLYGLSQKVNFTMALLNASQAARARGIDGLIREITSLAKSAPAEEEKKQPVERLIRRPRSGVTDPPVENREENQSSAETRPELPQTGTQAAPPEVKPISPPLKTAEAPPTTPAVAVPATPSAVSDDEWQATADRADEENWEDTGEHPLLDDGGSWSLPETTAAPVSHSLAELTEMLPESTRDALDHYLRGKFISVTKLDRSRLL